MSIVNDDGRRRRRTDGRRLDGYTISSPCDPNGSEELNIQWMPHSFSVNIKISQPKKVNIIFEGKLILMLNEKEYTNCCVL